MRIRPYTPEDWIEVWPILEAIIRAGEVLALARDLSEAEAKEAWTGDARQVYVAVDERSNQILGSYYLRPNQEGGGSHVSNCGYAVSEEARGRGIAASMCEHSQAEAVARGFSAMQFNLVVSTNEAAVHLWKKLGFEVIGTIPEAFDHPRAGLVDAHIMYKRLRPRPGQEPPDDQGTGA
jgi:ribosomal protein S18 acetylase RimI-like enzyme